MATLSVNYNERFLGKTDEWAAWSRFFRHFWTNMSLYSEANRKTMKELDRASPLFLINDYDESWPVRASSHISIIKGHLKDCPWFVDVQHIGSTSVPGLASKPIIDLMFGVSSQEGFYYAAKYLNDIGYKMSCNAFGVPQADKSLVYFMGHDSDGYYHSMLLIIHNSDLWKDKILFRDYLRTHPEEREKYEYVKRTFIKKDLLFDEYTASKGIYIDQMKEKARAELNLNL